MCLFGTLRYVHIIHVHTNSGAMRRKKHTLGQDVSIGHLAGWTHPIQRPVDEHTMGGPRASCKPCKAVRSHLAAILFLSSGEQSIEPMAPTPSVGMNPTIASSTVRTEGVGRRGGRGEGGRERGMRGREVREGEGEGDCILIGQY